MRFDTKDEQRKTIGLNPQVSILEVNITIANRENQFTSTSKNSQIMDMEENEDLPTRKNGS